MPSLANDPLGALGEMRLFLRLLGTVRNAEFPPDELQLARGLPGGRQAWNDIEAGRRANLRIETLEKVAAALGVKAKDLLK